METTKVLMHEHRIIEQVLDCLEKSIAECSSKNLVDKTVAVQFLEFFRGFADGCHHGKEEEKLFPLLVSKGMGNGCGPVDVMLREHDLGRALLAAMDESIEGASKGDAKAVGHYVENAKGYIAMLREHIHKEDHCLFPAADRSMSEAEGKQLLDAFTKVDKEEIGEIVHKRFIETANALAKKFDVPLVEEKESCCCA